MIKAGIAFTVNILGYICSRELGVNFILGQPRQNLVRYEICNSVYRTIASTCTYHKLYNTYGEVYSIGVHTFVNHHGITDPVGNNVN
jgi:hypothetical protein